MRRRCIGGQTAELCGCWGHALHRRAHALFVLFCRLAPLRHVFNARTICCALLLLAVQPAGAVTVRVATFNILQGFEAPGTDSFEQAAAVMARVDADIVGVVEARSGTNEAVYFRQMAERLGYPYAVLSGTTPLDTTLRTAVFSRFPIVMTNWVQSPVGAVEMTRQNLGVKIDVPGTPNDPLIVVVHPKCCSSSSGQESFRRAIEMRRVREFVEANSIPALDNVFVVGDFNLVGTDNIEFGSLPSGLPQRYVLGSDVVWPVLYRRDPDFYFSSLAIARLPMAQVDGTTKTWSTRVSSSSVLDYMMASAPVRSRPFQTEIYNSALDGEGVGLPKPGPQPAIDATSRASDHYLLFGDFDLGAPPPAPVLEWPVAGDLVEGESLADSTLTGGVAAVAGTFGFADPEVIPAAGETSYPVIFTPDDTENYSAATNMVPVLVRPSGAASSYTAWLQGAPQTRENFGRYAIGGASDPMADGVAVTNTVTSSHITIIAIVRTNDANLTVVGQAASDLASGFWSTNGVTKISAPDQSNVPSGTERQVFSIERGTNSSLFLRIDSTLQE